MIFSTKITPHLNTSARISWSMSEILKFPSASPGFHCTKHWGFRLTGFDWFIDRSPRFPQRGRPQKVSTNTVLGKQNSFHSNQVLFTHSVYQSEWEEIFLPTPHKRPITFLLFSMLGMTFNRLTNWITDEINQSDINLLRYNHHSLLKSKFQESFSNLITETWNTCVAR